VCWGPADFFISRRGGRRTRPARCANRFLTIGSPFLATAGPPRKTALVVILENGGIMNNVDPDLRQRLNTDIRTVQCGHWEFELKAGERLPDLAGELVKIPVDLILVPGRRQAGAAKQATATIPIVFGALYGDPVQAGLVQSLARPGGNVTGTMAVGPHLIGKRLELLKETVSGLARVAVLVNSGWPLDLAQSFRAETQTDAARLGLQVQFVPAAVPGDFPGAFAAMTRARAQALVVPGDSMFPAAANVPVIANLALRHGLPGMYDERQYVTAGGLMTYAPNFEAVWKRTASYVDRILKGTRPADLPVEQPTRYDLVINLKTAKALGLTIPPSVLARADELIQ
jgi:ABC-type uncharacterized transport system substrate-binding protein